MSAVCESFKREGLKTRILGELDGGFRRSYIGLAVQLDWAPKMSSTLEALMTEGLVVKSSDCFVTLYSRPR